MTSLSVRPSATAAALALALALPSVGLAQAFSPADPAAPAASSDYRSAFEGYRYFGDVKVGNWRDLNDEVARVGGHVGIMRAGEASAQPVVGGHPSGHGNHGAPTAQTGATSPEAVRSGAAPTPGVDHAPSAGGHAGHGR